MMQKLTRYLPGLILSCSVGADTEAGVTPDSGDLEDAGAGAHGISFDPSLPSPFRRGSSCRSTDGHFVHLTSFISEPAESAVVLSAQLPPGSDELNMSWLPSIQVDGSNAVQVSDCSSTPPKVRMMRTLRGASVEKIETFSSNEHLRFDKLHCLDHVTGREMLGTSERGDILTRCSNTACLPQILFQGAFNCRAGYNFVDYNGVYAHFTIWGEPGDFYSEIRGADLDTLRFDMRGGIKHRLSENGTSMVVSFENPLAPRPTTRPLAIIDMAQPQLLLRLPDEIYSVRELWETTGGGWVARVTFSQQEAGSGCVNASGGVVWIDPEGRPSGFVGSPETELAFLFNETHAAFVVENESGSEVGYLMERRGGYPGCFD